MSGDRFVRGLLEYGLGSKKKKRVGVMCNGLRPWFGTR